MGGLLVASLSHLILTMGLPGEPWHQRREAYQKGRWWEGQARWLFLFLSEPEKIVQLSYVELTIIHEVPGEPFGLAEP